MGMTQLQYECQAASIYAMNDREAKYLIQEFWNQLALGQFENARALTYTLADQGVDGKEQVKSLWSEVLAGPGLQGRHLTFDISRRTQLLWLSLMEYEAMGGVGIDPLFRNHLEFELLLDSLLEVPTANALVVVADPEKRSLEQLSDIVNALVKGERQKRSAEKGSRNWAVGYKGPISERIFFREKESHTTTSISDLEIAGLQSFLAKVPLVLPHLMRITSALTSHQCYQLRRSIRAICVSYVEVRLKEVVDDIRPASDWIQLLMYMPWWTKEERIRNTADDQVDRRNLADVVRLLFRTLRRVAWSSHQDPEWNKVIVELAYGVQIPEEDVEEWTWWLSEFKASDTQAFKSSEYWTFLWSRRIASQAEADAKDEFKTFILPLALQLYARNESPVAAVFSAAKALINNDDWDGLQDVFLPVPQWKSLFILSEACNITQMNMTELKRLWKLMQALFPETVLQELCYPKLRCGPLEIACIRTYYAFVVSLWVMSVVDPSIATNRVSEVTRTPRRRTIVHTRFASVLDPETISRIFNSSDPDVLRMLRRLLSELCSGSIPSVLQRDGILDKLPIDDLQVLVLSRPICCRADSASLVLDYSFLQWYACISHMVGMMTTDSTEQSASSGDEEEFDLEFQLRYIAVRFESTWPISFQLSILEGMFRLLMIRVPITKDSGAVSTDYISSLPLFDAITSFILNSLSSWDEWILRSENCPIWAHSYVSNSEETEAASIVEELSVSKARFFRLRKVVDKLRLNYCFLNSIQLGGQGSSIWDVMSAELGSAPNPLNWVTVDASTIMVVLLKTSTSFSRKYLDQQSGTLVVRDLLASPDYRRLSGMMDDFDELSGLLETAYPDVNEYISRSCESQDAGDLQYRTMIALDLVLRYLCRDESHLTGLEEKDEFIPDISLIDAMRRLVDKFLEKCTASGLNSSHPSVLYARATSRVLFRWNHVLERGSGTAIPDRISATRAIVQNLLDPIMTATYVTATRDRLSGSNVDGEADEADASATTEQRLRSAWDSAFNEMAEERSCLNTLLLAEHGTKAASRGTSVFQSAPRSLASFAESSAPSSPRSSSTATTPNVRENEPEWVMTKKKLVDLIARLSAVRSGATSWRLQNDADTERSVQPFEYVNRFLLYALQLHEIVYRHDKHYRERGHVLRIIHQAPLSTLSRLMFDFGEPEFDVAERYAQKCKLSIPAAVATHCIVRAFQDHETYTTKLRATLVEEDDHVQHDRSLCTTGGPLDIARVHAQSGAAFCSRIPVPGYVPSHLKAIFEYCSPQQPLAMPVAAMFTWLPEQWMSGTWSWAMKELVVQAPALYRWFALRWKPLRIWSSTVHGTLSIANRSSPHTPHTPAAGSTFEDDDTMEENEIDSLMRLAGEYASWQFDTSAAEQSPIAELFLPGRSKKSPGERVSGGDEEGGVRALVSVQEIEKLSWTDVLHTFAKSFTTHGGEDSGVSLSALNSPSGSSSSQAFAHALRNMLELSRIYPSEAFFSPFADTKASHSEVYKLLQSQLMHHGKVELAETVAGMDDTDIAASVDDALLLWLLSSDNYSEHLASDDSSSKQPDRVVSESWRHILRLRDRSLIAPLVLAHFRSWSIDRAIIMLEMCLTLELPSAEGLQTGTMNRHHRLRAVLKQLSLLREILACPQACDIYDSWRTLSERIEENPEQVVNVIVKWGQYALARSLVSVLQAGWSHQLGDTEDGERWAMKLVEIEVECICNMVDSGAELKALSEAVNEAIARVDTDHVVTLFKSCVDRVSQYDVKHHVSEMAMHDERFLKSVGDEEYNDWCLKHSGWKLMDRLPVALQDRMKKVLSYPHVILENLLMLGEVSMVRSILGTSEPHSHTRHSSGDRHSPRKPTRGDQRSGPRTNDDLIMKYAEKAITVTEGKRDTVSDLSIASGNRRDNIELLSGDPESDSRVRANFKYPSAPDMFLFKSLLDLCSQPALAADFCLNLCDRMSEQLFTEQRSTSAQTLRFSLIHHLLVHAKVLYFDDGNVDASIRMETCDTMLAKLDILKTLVVRNIDLKVRLADLSNQQSARRIRDHLIEEDQNQLALEIALKCNVEAAPIWMAWGIALLKVGRYARARRMFKYVIGDMRAKENSQEVLLERIIRTLETCLLLQLPETDTEPVTCFPVMRWASQHMNSSSDDFGVPELKDADSTEFGSSSALSGEDGTDEQGRSWKFMLNLTRGNNFAFTAFPEAQRRSVLQRLDERISLIQFIDALQSRLVTGAELTDLWTRVDMPKNPTIGSPPRWMNISTDVLMESIYYLHQMGDDMTVVRYLMRIQRFQDAVTYYVTRKLNQDVFTSTIVDPLYRYGSIGSLQSASLLSESGTLPEEYTPYLISACMFLDTKRAYHLLYNVQVFMQDFVRAGLTCIKLFSAHKVQARKAQWLVSAETCFQKIIDSPQTDEVQMAKASAYLRAVNLQREVMQCVGVEHGEAPSMWDYKNKKCELCERLMTMDLDLSLRIIQEYDLPLSMIYANCCKKLAQKESLPKLRALMSTMRETVDEKMYDEVVLICIDILLQLCKAPAVAAEYLAEIHDDMSRARGCLKCGEYRNAYLIGAKIASPEIIAIVQETCEENAHSSKQANKVLGLCRQFMIQYRAQHQQS